MVFALLIAAIIWNLSTWWFGLPASSSHTMVGSIIGVGVANQLMNAHTGTSGVDWEQATKVFKVLLISPVVGFGCAGSAVSALEVVHQVPGTVRGAEGQHASTVADSRAADSDLLGRELFARLE